MKIKEIKIPKSIIYLFSLALVLNILRVFLFGNTAFLYILWNILLAFIPFFISSILLLRTNKENIIKPFFIIGFILWFIFLPNAPYVVTDFIHLGRIHSVPVMYDIFLLFASAWVSLLMGLHSLLHMEKILLLKFRSKIVDIIILITILFTSFGLYLGRYLRFNSWDLFTSHTSLVSTVWDIFTRGNDYINVYSYTILFFFFIYISYISFKNRDIG
ncbi:MAG: DUF1361 domain-containing protein [Candidatus Paceibacterota bacterium]|jgi:uncharacterized membrane protein